MNPLRKAKRMSRSLVAAALALVCTIAGLSSPASAQTPSKAVAIIMAETTSGAIALTSVDLLDGGSGHCDAIKNGLKNMEVVDSGDAKEVKRPRIMISCVTRQ